MAKREREDNEEFEQAEDEARVRLRAEANVRRAAAYAISQFFLCRSYGLPSVKN